MDKICYFAPATSANLSAGYDLLGLALNFEYHSKALGDKVTVSKASEPGVQIGQIMGVPKDALPFSPDKNTASVAVKALLDHVQYSGGIVLDIEKNMPLCSGMGSSAASAAAAVVATNHLLDLNLSKKQLIPFAMQGEKAASGNAHADNVAPALLGGIVVIRSYFPLDIIRLPVPDNLYISIIHPNIEINTAQARSLVPPQISVAHCTQQMGNIASFISGLFLNDMKLVSQGIEDWIAEPYRAISIPGFSLVKQAAIEAGALGAGLSGSGPSMFAFSDSIEVAQKSALKMSKVFERQHISNHVYYGKISTQGAHQIF